MVDFVLYFMEVFEIVGPFLDAGQELLFFYGVARTEILGNCGKSDGSARNYSCIAVAIV